jgi:hypothetical protein
LEVDGDRGNDLLYGGPGEDGGAPTGENLRHHGLRGEDGADTITAADGVEDVIHCGPGLDTVVSYDRGLDKLVDCENATPSATAQQIASATTPASAPAAKIHP